MPAGFLKREEDRAFLGTLSQLPWPLLVAVTLVLVLAERYSLMYGRNVVDDAMTSMQYAKQLALGNGLVFNPGERVEGYTNFAWVVLMTPIYWLSTHLAFDFVVAVVHFTELVAAFVLVLVFGISRALFGVRSLFTWLALGILVVDNSFTVWAILGLEVHLLALFMLLALAALMSSTRFRWLWVGLALLGAHLTRPDAGLFCAVVLANELLEAWLDLRRGNRTAARWRAGEALLAGCVWVALYGAYFFWRWRYFGDLMPNTYYLKLGGHIDAWGRGLQYLGSFLRVRNYLPLLALLAVFSLRRPVVRGVLLYNLLHATYVVYVGGDFFSGHRFFVPELPQLALLIAVGVADAAVWLKRTRAVGRLQASGVSDVNLRWMLLMAFAASLLGVYRRGLNQGPLAEEVQAWGGDLTRQTKLFRWLREHKLPGASVANTLIGHTGFYAETRVIDVCGVIDRVTAHREVQNFGKGKAGHEKFAPPEYILAQNPTYVALGAVRQDLWQRGYYLRADIPENTFEGIWEKDPLPATGTFLEETRISFDGPAPAGWVSRGDAFAHWPARKNHPGQGEIVGASRGFVNTFHPELHDQATGTLISAPFPLLGDLLLFRMAGGQDREKLFVELLVDGARVYTTTGRRGDHMSRRAWDISALRGKQGTLRIVDESTAKWGFIAVDEVVQWKRH